MNKTLIAIAGVVLTLAATTAAFAYQHVTGGGTAAAAAHDVLLALYPSWKASLDQQLEGELAAIPSGTAKVEGIAVGHLAAQLAVASRADDGSNATLPAIPVGTEPGQYRPAPPAFTP